MTPSWTMGRPENGSGVERVACGRRRKVVLCIFVMDTAQRVMERANPLIYLALNIVIANAALPIASAQFLQQGDKLTVGTSGDPAGLGGAVALSADGNTAIMSARPSNLAPSVWVFTRAGNTWVQGSNLIGTGFVGPAAGAVYSVALSGDSNTAIVGVPGDNGEAGAAWIFARSAGAWSQQGGKLVGASAVGAAQQGSSVAISADGNTTIVGGPYDNNQAGAAWIFTRNGTTWKQQGGKLIGSGAVGAAAQGYVALSSDGDSALVAGPGDNNAGAMWVFTRAGSSWSQLGPKIVAPVANSGTGRSVAISSDGTTAIAGAPFEGPNGGAWVFTQVGGVWTAQGSELVGSRSLLTSGDEGLSVALSADGNTAVIGGPLGGGAAWVFGRTGSTWSQIGDPLSGVDAAGIPAQGTSVAISGDGQTILVSGPGDNFGNGAVWAYVRSSGPYILSNGVVNGASFLPGIAPGAWITIDGLNLSATTRTWQASDFSGNNLPTELDGVQVTVNGKQAYVYYVSPTQLNVLAPDDSMAGPIPIGVINLQGVSNVVNATESAFSPALFAFSEPTGGYVAAVGSDGAYITPSAPAKPGDTILLYGTGFGSTTPAQPAGQLVNPSPLANPVTLQINGLNATTTFAGLVSSGLYQFNVVVPNVPDGDRPVSVEIGGVVSQPTLLLSVKQ